MKIWGLSIVTLGGLTIVMTGQQPNALGFTLLGLALIGAGIIVFRKAKS